MSQRPDRPTIVPAELRLPPGHAWTRLPWIGGACAAVGLAAAWGLARGDLRQFHFSWLVAFLFFLSIALGGLFFVLVHYATKAGWSVVVRRIAENAMATLPFFVLLFVPVLLGLDELFLWADEAAVGSDHLLHAKEPYLNRGFFLARAALYFVAWTALAVYFASQSRRQDESGDHAITRRLQSISAPAIAVFALTVTFASIDWVMSLDPHWYSTIFGVYFFSGSVVAIYAFLSIVAVAGRAAGFFRGILSAEHFHDLGKLLFAFTVFWAYIAFSQYFLIWYGNIPEETLWYIHRLEGGWTSTSILLALGHFVVPFLFLMPQSVKRRPALLLGGALWMLAMHLLDLHWLVMPTLHPHGPHFGLVDVAALLGVGGAFVAAFGWSLRRAALLPVRDPRLPESLAS